MRRVRLAIADDNLEVQQNLTNFLSAKEDIEIVGVASNGLEAKNLVLAMMPDVLVLDLIMPVQDGFAVMQQLRQLGHTALRIIILSGLTRDALVRRAMNMGAYYYLPKPFDYELLYNYIVEEDRFSDESQVTALPAVDESQRLNQMLGEVLDIPMHTKGGRYLHTAVRVAGGFGSLGGRITKEVYPAVAQLHNSNVSQVERAIRHAIEIAWVRGEMRKSTLFHGTTRPSNGEVILALVGQLRDTACQGMG